jgi:hypothetical protein
MRLASAALIGVIVTGYAGAQNNAVTPGVQGSTGRTFNVEILEAPAAALAYLDPVHVTLRVTATDITDFGGVRIIPVGDLVAIYDPDVRDSDVTGRTCRIEGSLQLQKDSAFIATCELAVARTVRHQLQGPVVLARPGRNKVLIEITAIQEAKRVPYHQELTLPFISPTSAIFMGGLAGAFLLALFAAIRERAEKAITPISLSSDSVKTIGLDILSWTLNLIPRIWRMALQTVIGGICAIILILIAQATDGLEPPISIRIQDFWGGVVVGLFSAPLSRWISGRLESLEK